ncbi:hypothetical protein U1Q18_037294 [Sarracenia purpurea var. burkii]
MKFFLIGVYARRRGSLAAGDQTKKVGSSGVGPRNVVGDHPVAADPTNVSNQVQWKPLGRAPDRDRKLFVSKAHFDLPRNQGARLLSPEGGVDMKAYRSDFSPNPIGHPFAGLQPHLSERTKFDQEQGSADQEQRWLWRLWSGVDLFSKLASNLIGAVMFAFDFSGGASCSVNLFCFCFLLSFWSSKKWNEIKYCGSKKWNENYRRVLFQWNEVRHSGSSAVVSVECCFMYCIFWLLLSRSSDQFWLQILGSGCGSVSAAIILGLQGALSFVLGPL